MVMCFNTCGAFLSGKTLNSILELLLLEWRNKIRYMWVPKNREGRQMTAGGTHEIKTGKDIKTKNSGNNIYTRSAYRHTSVSAYFPCSMSATCLEDFL